MKIRRVVKIRNGRCALSPVKARPPRRRAMQALKVFVNTRVVEGGKVCVSLGKLYDETESLKFVVDKSLEKAATKVQCSLIVQRVTAASTEEGRGMELDLEDLPELQVAQLRDGAGRFLTVLAERTVDSAGTPRSLPSASSEMMDAQARTPRALPVPPAGPNLAHRLARALINNMAAENLSFPILDAEQSGKIMVRLVSECLQYVLPFDVAEPSPLRASGRVHLVVPTRFSTEVSARLVAVVVGVVVVVEKLASS